MHQLSIFGSSLCLLSLSCIASADDAVSTSTQTADTETSTITTTTTTKTHTSPFLHLKEITHETITKLKVDANAEQPDEVKDPLQTINRKVFVFNDALDRHVLRPIAVQYQTKIPEDVRGSYRGFKDNLGEPWNAVNQVAQWKPKRALKTLGRFTINTLTTLGLADPARRLGLDQQSESLGVTLGYYGMPSGPYLMLPFFGPSTVRDGLGSIVDLEAQPQRYIFDDYKGLYWTNAALGAIDLRSSLLDIDQSLQGDRYAAIRDAYLQRKHFQIAQRQGKDDQVSFVDDDPLNQ
ncbi:VacJ family lipoprotein [Acinetobacter sp. MD2(2019)]|uniref:MlaA family lipoprotein n=1 Tax=Acinetobacter sp. MD2(2019) TaxID=2605273 RepID=UPI002D1E945E|nr:VacJ family lipoprotein [Acinetobacter sp. MD2(2019)]MEB3755151.1 VacJ family lipoprotein [Acinetobacter sp. MD2(2019)]